MKEIIKKCLICGEAFIPKAKNQYGWQKYCSKKCMRKGSQKGKRKYLHSPPQTSINQKIEKPSIKEETFLKGLNGDLKAIDKYKKLSQEICILMRKNRISKYGINTQNIILDLMKACFKHLDNELNKKEVIKADWCE